MRHRPCLAWTVGLLLLAGMGLATFVGWRQEELEHRLGRLRDERERVVTTATNRPALYGRPRPGNGWGRYLAARRLVDDQGLRLPSDPGAVAPPALVADLLARIGEGALRSLGKRPDPGELQRLWLHPFPHDVHQAASWSARHRLAGRCFHRALAPLLAAAWFHADLLRLDLPGAGSWLRADLAELARCLAVAGPEGRAGVAPVLARLDASLPSPSAGLLRWEIDMLQGGLAAAEPRSFFPRPPDIRRRLTWLTGRPLRLLDLPGLLEDMGRLRLAADREWSRLATVGGETGVGGGWATLLGLQEYGRSGWSVTCRGQVVEHRQMRSMVRLLLMACDDALPQVDPFGDGAFLGRVLVSGGECWWSRGPKGLTGPAGPPGGRVGFTWIRGGPVLFLPAELSPGPLAGGRGASTAR